MDFAIQFKENESKIHEKLYNNLYLLSQIYPTSKDFKTIFKKDMFVKNNKAAFFEVVYYLLHNLNPNLIKEKITTWPPYDIKRENKFRSEILQVIKELNVLYDNANIPPIMQSHLISPGGLKFTKFMLKLSQLVIYEHLKKRDEKLIFCPHIGKNTNLTKLNISNLKKKTKVIDNETNAIYEDCFKFQIEMRKQADKLTNDLTELNDNIREAKTTYNSTKEQFIKNHPNSLSLSNIEEKIDSLTKQWEQLLSVHNLFISCRKLVEHLNSNDNVLEHKKGFEMPKEISHIVRNKDKLDLVEFFEGLNVLLVNKSLELPYPTADFVNSNCEKFESLIKVLDEKSSQCAKSQDSFLKDMMEFMEKFEDFKRDEDEDLAVPLNYSFG